MSYWLAIGPPENWTFCFNNGNIWGFSPRYQKPWASLTEGDTVFCYATRPVMGVIGYCTVRSKQREERTFFPQEIKEQTVLWPLRVVLSSDKMIPEGEWSSRRVALERKGITLQRALQRFPEERAKEVIKGLKRA